MWRPDGGYRKECIYVYNTTVLGVLRGCYSLLHDLLFLLQMKGTHHSGKVGVSTRVQEDNVWPGQGRSIDIVGEGWQAWEGNTCPPAPTWHPAESRTGAFRGRHHAQ